MSGTSRSVDEPDDEGATGMVPSVGIFVVSFPQGMHVDVRVRQWRCFRQRSPVAVALGILGIVSRTGKLVALGRVRVRIRRWWSLE